MKIILLMAGMLAGCVLSLGSRVASPEEDESIVFPEFDAELPVAVGANGALYELDGVMLRAIMIAANDYIPTGSQRRYCWQTQEAQEYRVLRRGDIIFVGINVNPRYCKVDFMLLDDGMRYAISIDGRILRRLSASQPDGSRFHSLDAGERNSLAEPVPDTLVGSTELGGPGFIPPQWRRDGGSQVGPSLTPQAPVVFDGGASWDAGFSPGSGLSF